MPPLQPEQYDRFARVFDAVFGLYSIDPESRPSLNLRGDIAVAALRVWAINRGFECEPVPMVRPADDGRPITWTWWRVRTGEYVASLVDADSPETTGDLPVSAA